MEIVRQQKGTVTYWQAIFANEKVGEIGAYREKPNVGLICDFNVDAARQGYGIGSCLLVRALQDLKKDGVEVIRVCAMRPETRAHNLFEQAGFLPISNRVFVAGEIIDMELKL